MNVPTDVKKSINKLRDIIRVIEENLYAPKENILMEISIELDITIEAARKIFRLYYPIEKINLSTYIVVYMTPGGIFF